MTEPKTISELMTLVMEECKKGNYNSAIIYLNKAIEIDPNDARFYISRGTFKGKENDKDAIEGYIPLKSEERIELITALKM